MAQFFKQNNTCFFSLLVCIYERNKGGGANVSKDDNSKLNCFIMQYMKYMLHYYFIIIIITNFFNVTVNIFLFCGTFYSSYIIKNITFNLASKMK